MTSKKDIVFFRAVIASPNDVKPERVFVRKVIDTVNETLESLGKNYRIKIVEQKDVAPRGGNAEEVVSQLLEIENCHIFIGIFWRRFGKPPQIARPGTEAEINAAFAARGEKNGLQPEIMIYRRTDKSNQTIREKDKEGIIQNRKLLSYFREFETNDRNQAIWQKFEVKEFRELLRNSLIRICTNNENRWLKNNDTLGFSRYSKNVRFKPDSEKKVKIKKKRFYSHRR